MEAVPGLVAKDGAEASSPRPFPTGGRSRSLADGSWRAFAPVALAALDHLGVDTSGAMAWRTPVLGGGRPVGEAHAVPF